MSNKITREKIKEAYRNCRTMQDVRPLVPKLVDELINLTPGYGIVAGDYALGIMTENNAFFADLRVPREQREYIEFPVEWLEKSAVVGYILNDFVSDPANANVKVKSLVNYFVRE